MENNNSQPKVRNAYITDPHILRKPEQENINKVGKELTSTALLRKH